MGKVTDTVWELALPIARENDLIIWDVEFVKEAGQRYLRVFIDREEGGVFIDDCEKVSRALDTILDEKDFIPESYIFEVSSAGAERELKRPSDFSRFMGSFVEVKLYKPLDGQKAFTGHLKAYEDGDITIDSNGDEKTLEKARIAKVKLRIE